MKAQHTRLAAASPPTIPTSRKSSPEDVYRRIRATCASRGLRLPLFVLSPSLQPLGKGLTGLCAALARTHGSPALSILPNFLLAR